VRLDKTISSLQKERNKLQKTSENLEQVKSEALLHADNLSLKHTKVQEKLENFYELYTNNQKMLVYGRKINELINTYFQTNNKKQFHANFAKWVAMEKTKYLKRNPTKPITKAEKKKIKITTKKIEEKLKIVEKEVLTEVKKVKEQKIVTAKKS
jgi:DNA mismatch repair protein MutS2